MDHQHPGAVASGDQFAGVRLRCRDGGGGRYDARPLLEKVLARLPPLYQSVRGRYLPAQRVKMGMTGTDTAALGAAALPIFDEFNPQFQVLMKAVNTNALFGKAK